MPLPLGVGMRRTAAAASHLARDGVGLVDLVPPVASPSHRNDGELGQDDGPADGSVYLRGALNTQTHVSIVVQWATNALNRVLWPVHVCGMYG